MAAWPDAELEGALISGDGCWASGSLLGVSRKSGNIMGLGFRA